MPTTLPVSYTTIGLIHNAEPNIGSVTTLSSLQKAQFAGQAESRINAKISQKYSLPFTKNIDILQTLATNMSVYYILSRRLFTANQLTNSPWPDRYKESLEDLDSIAAGTMDLVDSSGAVVAGRTDQETIFSTTQDNVPTFWEGPRTDQIVDADKIDSEADRRDITVRRLLE